MTENAQRVVQFMARVWSTGDLSAAGEYLAEHYTIYSDPSDAWEGQTLSHDGFNARRPDA